MCRSLPIPSPLLSEVHYQTQNTFIFTALAQHVYPTLQYKCARFCCYCVSLLNNNACILQALWMTSFSPRPHARGSVETSRCSPARNRPTLGKNMLTFPYKSHLNTNFIAFDNICVWTGENVMFFHMVCCALYPLICITPLFQHSQINKTLPRFMITHLFIFF